MKMGKKTLVNIALVMGGLLLVIGIMFLIRFASPLEKLKKALSKGETDRVLELYLTKLEGSSDEGRAQSLIRGEIKILPREFKAGGKDYETVSRELDAFSEIDELSEEAGKTRSEIEYFQASFMAFATAEELLAKGNYREAMEWYLQVVEEDDNYDTAQQKAKESGKAYKEDVLQQVDALVVEEKYADANTILMVALGMFPEDAELNQKWNVIAVDQEKYLIKAELSDIDKLLTEKKYAEAVELAADAADYYGDPQLENKYREAAQAYGDDITAQVDKLLQAKDLQGAMDKVSELSMVLPQSEIAQDLSEKVMKYIPVKLSELPITDSRKIYGNEVVSPKDMRGNTYEWGLTYYDPCGWTKQEATYEVYLLNKEYKYFTAVIVPSEDHAKNGKEVTFKIQKNTGNGDIEVFSTDMDIYSEPAKIDLDVTGADCLTIQFYGGYQAKFLLAEPELVKERLE